MMRDLGCGVLYSKKETDNYLERAGCPTKSMWPGYHWLSWTTTVCPSGTTSHHTHEHGFIPQESGSHINLVVSDVFKYLISEN